MPELRIVVADSITGSGIDLLRETFGRQAVAVRGKLSEEELCQATDGMDALLVRSATTVTRRAIESGARLRLIGRAGVGTDNIDKDAATEHGIVVMNTPLGNTISAAEQAIALIFATARNTARADALMQGGVWAKKELAGVEVCDKTLGLVGLGKIGTHVAKVMRAAGMKVIAFDPYLPPEHAKRLGVALVDLDELVAVADFVSLHTPLTERTRGLFDAELLRRMKPGARLVNCARGGIVDEAALAELVAGGHIAAAGLDVFSAEPITEGPLFGVEGITLTPHLGASTGEAAERCGLQLAEQVVAFFKEGAIINSVNVSITVDPSLRPYVEVAEAMGLLAATMLGAAPERVELACAGELAERDTSHITASAVLGVLRTFGPEDVNIVNAAYLARQRGIEICEVSGQPAGTFRSRVDLVVSGAGKTCRTSGTAYDNTSPRIVQINEFGVDLLPRDHIIIMSYPDRPGYVGKFGTILADHNINIASMDVGRTKKRGQAVIAMTLDEKPGRRVMSEINSVEDVRAAYLVSFRPGEAAEG